jgi:hypothetical protein
MIRPHLWRLTRVLFILHARLRVRLAPGFPCALSVRVPIHATTRARAALRERICTSSVIARAYQAMHHLKKPAANSDAMVAPSIGRSDRNHDHVDGVNDDKMSLMVVLETRPEH